jgi:hypothetical protein
MIHSLNSSKPHGVTRRKTGAYAVTPTTHGVTTAYAVFARKPLYSLSSTDGVKNGVTHNLSHTPSRAKYYLA